MDTKVIEVTALINQLLSAGKTRPDIEASLIEKGYDLSAFAQDIDTCVATHITKQRNSGHMLIAAGALTCLASCLITLVSGSASSSGFTLIGLTSAGIIILFAGLMKIF